MVNPFFRWCVAFAGLYIALFGCDTRADCTGDDPDIVPVALEMVRVPRQLLDYSGAHLLGLAGERVRVGYDAPDFSIEMNRAVLNPAWQERVDWSAYGAPDANAAHSRLYFDRRADGTRRLCRIDAMALAGDAPEGLPGMPIVHAVDIFKYGANGRLVEIAHHAIVDGGARTWDAPKRDCYFYDAAGWPVSKVGRYDGSCSQAKPSDAPVRYVHASDGHLLRVFHQRTDLTEGGVENVDIIDTYGDDGEMRRRYINAPNRPPRLTALPRSGRRGMAERRMDEIGVGQAPWRIRIDRPEVPVSERAPWRFVLMKPEFSRRGQYPEPDAEREVVADGRADASGMIALTAAQQRRLTNLVQQYPGLVVLRVSVLRHYSLWPEVPQAVWERCHDPARIAPADCE